MNSLDKFVIWLSEVENMTIIWHDHYWEYTVETSFGGIEYIAFLGMFRCTVYEKLLDGRFKILWDDSLGHIRWSISY